MCKTLRANRRFLISLVYELGVFDLNQILHEYAIRRNNVRSLALDGGQSAAEYVEELVDVGVLTRTYEKYAVQSSHWAEDLNRPDFSGGSVT